MSEAVVFPLNLRSGADVMETLFVRSFIWTHRARLFDERSQPRCAVGRNGNGASAGRFGFRCFNLDEMFFSGQVDLGPVEPRNLSGAESAKRSDGQVGYHGLTIAHFSPLCYRRHAGGEKFSKFHRRENLDLTAIF